MTVPNDFAAGTSPGSLATPTSPDDARLILRAAPPQLGDSPNRNSSVPLERLAAEVARLDRLMVVGVLVLAFFAASFAATNSDLWMHLAAGRLIARGQFPFGADPFAYTTEGVGWVNHAWLSDLTLYAIAQAFGGADTQVGGAVLVLLKAVLFTALAAVLLAFRRRHESPWSAVVTTTLAVLAMGPRLLLQPACVSYLFLAVTLYLLWKPVGSASPRRRLFLIPLLFALWVNLDSWFVLGPLTVALFLAGEALQQFLGSSRPAIGAEEKRLGLRPLGMVLLFGVAACLFNPYHVHAFAVPPDLQSLRLAPVLGVDPDFRGFFLSPWDGDYLANPNLGRNAAGAAYFLLTALGAVSFGLNASGLRWWRVFVFVPFLVLTVVWARAVPFFAVVAAPIAALNLQDFAARRVDRAARAEAGLGVGSLAGRAATLVVLLALLALAWPGWLFARPADPRFSRRVAWRVDVDDSLRQAAARLAELRAAGVLRPGAHGFNGSPDVANYVAWYCPEEKGFFDYRFHLFGPEAARAYVAVRQALSAPTGMFAPAKPAAGEMSAAAPDRDLSEWQSVFRDPRAPIDHLVVSGPNSDANLVTLLRVWTSPEEWTPLYQDGRTAIIGWGDPLRPSAADPFREYQVALDTAAFRESAAPRPPAAAPPVAAGAWERYARGRGPRARAADEALTYLYFADAREAWNRGRNTRTHVAAWVGAGAGAAFGRGRLTEPVAVTYTLNPGLLLQGREAAGVAAAPLLAVRAARRAVAANPRDAEAYLALAKAVQHLWMYQHNRWKSAAHLLDQIREVQVVSALEHALLLDPDSAEAHQLLSQTYSQMNSGDQRLPTHLDMAVEHQKEWLRLARAAGPRGESRERFEQRMASEEAALRANEQTLQQRRTDFQLRGEKQLPLLRAELALRYGLAKQAVELLLESDVSQYGPDEIRRMLTLLLRSGRIDEVVRDAAVDDPLNQILVSAAVGDYDRADQALAGLQHATGQMRTRRALEFLRTQLTPSAVTPSGLRGPGELAAAAQSWADLTVLRGVLALEAGDVAEASEHFETALRSSAPPSGTTASAFPFSYLPMAAWYQDRVREQNGGDLPRPSR